jgi:hypothetical protein
LVDEGLTILLETKIRKLLGNCFCFPLTVHLRMWSESRRLQILILKRLSSFDFGEFLVVLWLVMNPDFKFDQSHIFESKFKAHRKGSGQRWQTIWDSFDPTYKSFWEVAVGAVWIVAFCSSSVCQRSNT